MDTRPKVSVVVPAFNAGRFLPETLKSVLRQTYPHWECLVVDDGSTDDTAAVARAACESDPRFRYHFQRNRFCAGARNAGLGLATGEYVQFLDADDLILEEKLEAQVAILETHPEIDVSYSDYRPFQSETGALLDPFWPETLGPNPLADFLFRWERGICIPIHAALFRRALWPSPDVFDERLRAKEDWVMWIGLALAGRRFHYLDRDLARYRLHQTNTYTESGMGLTFLYAAAIVAGKLPLELRGRFLDESFRHASWRSREELSAHVSAPPVSGEVGYLRGEVERLRANLAALQRPPESGPDLAASDLAASRPTLAACTIISRNYLAQQFQRSPGEKGKSCGVVRIVSLNGCVQVISVEVLIRADEIDGDLTAQRGTEDLSFLIFARSVNPDASARVGRNTVL